MAVELNEDTDKVVLDGDRAEATADFASRLAQQWADNVTISNVGKVDIPDPETEDA